MHTFRPGTFGTLEELEAVNVAGVMGRILGQIDCDTRGIDSDLVMPGAQSKLRRAGTTRVCLIDSDLGRATQIEPSRATLIGTRRFRQVRLNFYRLG